MVSRLKKTDLKIEYMRGQGPGGQHKNKTDSAVRVTHIPTGIHVTIDGRNQHHNKRAALKELDERLIEYSNKEKAKQKKKQRDQKIKDKKTIRTYNFHTGIVTDHRTGKSASIKNVLKKGKLSLLR
jgi:peptide chain release factor 1